MALKNRFTFDPLLEVAVYDTHILPPVGARSILLKAAVMLRLNTVGVCPFTFKTT